MTHCTMSGCCTWSYILLLTNENDYIISATTLMFLKLFIVAIYVRLKRQKVKLLADVLGAAVCMKYICLSLRGTWSNAKARHANDFKHK